MCACKEGETSARECMRKKYSDKDCFTVSLKLHNWICLWVNPHSRTNFNSVKMYNIDKQSGDIPQISGTTNDVGKGLSYIEELEESGG